MIQIYGPKMSSAFRCYWLLEELGIPYEIMPFDFSKGDSQNPEYLKLNPNGKVPTMVDDGFVLWESMAINYYLMEKYNAMYLVGENLQQHAEVNKWTMWSLTDLYESVHALIIQKFGNLSESDFIKAAREQRLPKYLTVLENHLVGKENVALNKFTMADIATMSVVMMAEFINFNLSSYPNILRWKKSMSERPAFKKAAPQA